MIKLYHLPFLLDRCEPFMKKIEQRDGYIYVEYDDEYSLEVFVSTSKEVFELCQAKGCRKVLVNVTNMPGKVRTFQRFEIGVQGALIFHNAIKAAVLYRKEEIDWFAETVSKNRGLNAKIFSQMDEALQWLAVESYAKAL